MNGGCIAPEHWLKDAIGPAWSVVSAVTLAQQVSHMEIMCHGCSTSDSSLKRKEQKIAPVPVTCVENFVKALGSRFLLVQPWPLRSPGESTVRQRENPCMPFSVILIFEQINKFEGKKETFSLLF